MQKHRSWLFVSREITYKDVVLHVVRLGHTVDGFFFSSESYEASFKLVQAQTTVIKMAYELTEQKKVGLGLIGFGLSFTFLGVILYFDRGLLALGNLFWLIGVGLLLGWQSTWRLFTNINNLRGTVCFVLGIFLIFVRWPIIGIILEIYGCIVLFGGFWSTVKMLLSQIPFVGWIIQYPLMVLEQLVRGSR